MKFLTLDRQSVQSQELDCRAHCVSLKCVLPHGGVSDAVWWDVSSVQD